MREVTKRDWLLCSMLNCGYLDLAILDDVEYDWGDVLKQIDWMDGNITFNGLMEGVFELGACHIAEAVDDRICELEAVQLNSRELDEDEEQELKDLNSLNPDSDIQGYFNCLDTHAWFNQNEDIYRKYVPEALESFEMNTGIPFVS